MNSVAVTACLLSMRQVWPPSWLQEAAWGYDWFGEKAFCIIYRRCRRVRLLLLIMG